MGDLLEVVFGVLLGGVLRCELTGVGRIKLIEPDFCVRFDAKLLAVVQGSSCRRFENAAP